VDGRQAVDAVSLHAVVLAGGSGTRFWPWSTPARPKQFLPIGGAESLLVRTVQRIGPLVPTERTWVVASAGLAAEVRRHLPALGEDRLVVEPCARGTAAAIGLAALAVAGVDPDAVLAVLPSDHHVARGAAFRELLAVAAERAAEGAVVTLGVPPTRPETGFGYLERHGDRVVRFTEKPDRETAARFVAAGHLWNAGVFVARASVLRSVIAVHLPALHRVLEHIAAGEDAFAEAPGVSLDHGVMEPLAAAGTPPVVGLRADVGWSDLGSWSALAEVGAPDASGNVVSGTPVLIDSARNIVHTDGGTVALVGVSDLVVVRVGDSVLVCPRERSQEVRRVVEALAGGSE
jgi:mannose-1-phosphate guanylyltransferase